MTLAHLYLALAIVCEVAGTACLKLTHGFTRPLPSLLVAAGYVAAVYFMTLSIRSLPVGFVYAVWAGVGIVVIALLGVVFYGEPVDLPGIAGIALIVSGVVTLNAFSRMGGHG
ncbi:multidrug efflux SMR transporter [Oleispirillum naphthae]|uniref:DMT family transporter n=1 Tax=Oleispirillum naphthae TaxID=2838853 RepID=UPI0030822906